MNQQEEMPFLNVKYVLHYGSNVYHCRAEGGGHGMTRFIAEAEIFTSRSLALLKVKQIKESSGTTQNAPLPTPCRIK